MKKEIVTIVCTKHIPAGVELLEQIRMKHHVFLAHFVELAVVDTDDLLVGNGGEKNTRTYEESAELSGYVMDLQEFDKLLAEAQKEGTITIEKNVITGIEGKVFQLS